jgi:hypothetical protein
MPAQNYLDAETQLAVANYILKVGNWLSLRSFDSNKRGKNGFLGQCIFSWALKTHIDFDWGGLMKTIYHPRTKYWDSPPSNLATPASPTD